MFILFKDGSFTLNHATIIVYLSRSRNSAMNVGTLIIYFTSDECKHVEQESSPCKLCSCYGFKSWYWNKRQVALAVTQVSLWL